ncbi:hypothetical protein DMB37_38795 [Nocardia sp. CS682]|nr:hypothetical protein DMB37_38795 [Nocardia sp. CS682]
MIRYRSASRDIPPRCGTAIHAGCTIAARASAAEADRVGVGRHFPPPPYSNRRADLDDRSRSVVLSTDGHSPGEWVDTGEVLSQMLIRIGTAAPDHGRAPTPRRALSDVFHDSTIESGSTRDISPSRWPQYPIR